MGGVAIAGERGTAIAGRFGRAFAGYEGKAKAGLHGEIEITYRSPGTSLDGHILSGLVGQDDIKADTFYRLDDQGNFVEVTL